MERLDRDLREKHSLSLPEYEILVRLSESPGLELRMAELADSVKNSRSRITHTVKRLENAGYVARRACESDGRGVIAALTTSGYDKLSTAAPDHVESVRQGLIEVIDDEEFAVIGKAFEPSANASRRGRPTRCSPPAAADRHPPEHLAARGDGARAGSPAKFNPPAGRRTGPRCRMSAPRGRIGQ